MHMSAENPFEAFTPGNPEMWTPDQGLWFAVQLDTMLPERDIRLRQVWFFTENDKLNYRQGFPIRATIYGEPEGDDDPIVRPHSACMYSEVFYSVMCDCREQRNMAMQLMYEEGSGILLDLEGHEGRALGPANKARIYKLHWEDGLDTVEATKGLQLPEDDRLWAATAAVLRALGTPRVRVASKIIRANLMD